MKHCLLFIVFVLTFSVFASFPVANNGKAECVIVYPDAPELLDGINILPRDAADYLKKITGADFKVLKEKEYSGKQPAIFLGKTKAAEKAGINRKKMQPREWAVICNDDQLILAGGSLTGDMYALYYFLEKYLGVRYLSPEAEVIPSQKTVSIPNGTQRVKTAFRSYWNFHGMFRNATRVNPSGKDGFEKIKLYEYKLRSGERYNDGSMRKNSRKTGICHSFYKYVPPAKYFKTNPEYFSVTPEGKRAYLPNGQLCLSNKELRKLVTAQILKWIEEDKQKNPDNYALTYDFSQQDVADFFCLCKECKALTEKYGASSGLLLDFLNEVAREVGKKHPEIYILTLAYMHSETPPAGIKPEPNVIIWLTDLYVRSNRTKPLTSKENAKQLSYVKGWSRITKHLAIWDYWNMGTGNQPEVCIDAIASDIKTFRDYGVKYVMNECEIGESRYSLRPQSFIWLQYYVSYKLQENPDRNLEEIVNEFMENYYETAAPQVKQYLALLRKAIKENPPTAEEAHGQYFPYATPEFLRKCENILLNALTKTNSSAVQMRIRDELAVICYCMIRQLKNTPKAGFSLDEYVKKYTAHIQFHIDNTKLLTPYYRKLAHDYLKNDEIYTLQLKFTDLPKKYERYSADTLKLFGTRTASAYRDTSVLMADPESSLGRAAVFKPENIKFHKIPLKLGLFDGATKRQLSTTISDFPQDEKYHWFKIGNFKLGTNTKIWLTEFWHVTLLFKDTFISADGVKEEDNPNNYEFWVSLKFQGPAYVKGSQKPNSISLDRAFLARIKPGKNGTETFSDLPAELKNTDPKTVNCFNGRSLIAHKATSAVKIDVDSSEGTAAVFQPKDSTLHKKPFRMGLYDGKAKRQKTLSFHKFPADEKYHWVNLGDFEIGTNTVIWATSTWHIGVRLKNQTVKPGKYQVWASVKFQGPAYVNGSKKTNSVSIDRACIVPVKK